MVLKKTKSELKDMVLGWKDRAADYMKNQEAWKLLVGGIVLGIVIVVFRAIILPILFFAFVCGAIFYFMSPNESPNDKDYVVVEKEDDKKDN